MLYFVNNERYYLQTSNDSSPDLETNQSDVLSGVVAILFIVYMCYTHYTLTIYQYTYIYRKINCVIFQYVNFFKDFHLEMMIKL